MCPIVIIGMRVIHKSYRQLDSRYQRYSTATYFLSTGASGNVQHLPFGMQTNVELKLIEVLR